MSESQRVMSPNIYHVAGVDNIVADTLSHLKSNNAEEDKNESMTDNKMKQLHVTSQVRGIQADFPLEKDLTRAEQGKELA